MFHELTQQLNHVPAKPTLELYQSRTRLKEYQYRVSTDIDGFCLQQRPAMMLAADLKGKPQPFFSGQAQEVAMKCTLPPPRTHTHTHMLP